jgi:hypothetical protein
VPKPKELELALNRYGELELSCSQLSGWALGLPLARGGTAGEGRTEAEGEIHDQVAAEHLNEIQAR